MHARRLGRFKEGWNRRSPTIIARAHPARRRKMFQILRLAHDMFVNSICFITFFLTASSPTTAIVRGQNDPKSPRGITG